MNHTFLSVEETANLLKTSRDSIYMRLHRREFPKNTFTRLGRRILFIEDELIKYVLSDAATCLSD